MKNHKNLIRIYLLIFIVIIIIFEYFNDEKNQLKGIIKRVNEYISICNQWKLINGIQESKLKIPKITALIPCFNCSKTIKSSIRSIQNQRMSEIEILIVEDYSKDNSLEILREIEKEDKRIKIIENKKNMGTLFSRSIGALNSKGKFIMSLDNDDLFIDKDIFNICHKECENNNIDIVEFIGIKSLNQTLKSNPFPAICEYSKFKKINKIIKKPILNSFIYEKKNNEIIRLIDANIWGKCIKTEIYKKALNIIGEKVYTQYIITNEDRIINFVLFRVASSFKFIKKYGILHYINTSVVKKLWIKNTSYNELFNIEHIYNFTKNSIDVNICVYELFKYESNIKLRKNDIKIKELFNRIINNLLKDKFLTKKNKEKLINYRNKNKNFQIKKN